MSTPELLVLGSLEAVVDGAPATIGGRRARRILALLLANLDAPVRAELIADVVWDEDPPPSWRNTLQTYLSRLRATLGLAVERTGDAYMVRHQACSLDAWRFEQLRQEGLERLDAERLDEAAKQLQAAFDLWRGRAFDGLTDLEVIRERATHLEEQRLGVAEVLAMLELRRGDAVRALQVAGTALSTSPFHDGLASLRAQALGRVGRRVEALAELRAYRRRMRREVGLDPGPEVERTEQSLLDAAASAEAVSSRTPAPFPLELERAAYVPLAERTSQLREGIELWTRTVGTGTASALFVRGEPGAGKTRLAAAIAQHVRSTGGAVLYGRGAETPGPPHRTLTHALRAIEPRALHSVGGLLADLHGVLPHLVAADPDPPTEPAARVARLHAGLALLLEAVARDATGLLVVLDDLQWSAPTELAALHHIVAVARPSRVMVVGVVRDDRQDRGADAFLADLTRTGAATAITLAGLGVAGVADIFGSFGVELRADAQRDAWRATGGNPLLVTELAQTCRTGDDVRRWVGPDQLDVPATIVRLVNDRVQHLPDGGSALTWAALIGEQFEQEVLARASGDSGVLAALELAASAHLVQEDAPGRWAFRHSLTRQALGSVLSRSRRARRHTAIAEALEALDHSGIAADRAAYHWCLGATPGSTTTALLRALEAARRCISRLAPDEARLHVGRALAVAAMDVDPDPELVGMLHLAAAEASHLELDEPGRKASAERAFACARTAGSSPLAVESALVRNAFWTQGVFDAEAARIIDEAAQMTDAAADHIRLGSSLAAMLAVAGGDDGRPGRDPVQLAAVALRRARDEHPELWVTAATSLVIALWGREATRRQAVIATQMARRGGPDGSLLAARWGAAPRLALGDRASFEAMTAHLRERADQRGWSALRAYGLQGSCLSALLDGRFDDAARIGAEAVEAAHGHANFERVYVAQSFWIAAETNRLEAIEPLARPVVEENRHLPVFRAMLGLILSDGGQLDEAATTLEELSIGDFAAVPRDVLWLATIAAAVEIAIHVDAGRHAPALERMLLPYRGQLVVVAGGAFVYGAVDRFRAMLAALRGERHRALELFEAAAALEASIAAAPLVARTLVWQLRTCGDQQRTKHAILSELVAREDLPWARNALTTLPWR